ncbi:MAG: hypothetical protein K6G22_12405 [Lachnospiraceae bacterium]|nr:hypothetical protein [Lachnospiraceae bacterium]
MMEEKKTIFNYISQTFATYGAIVLIFIIFNIAIGENAKDYSTLFSMGKEGITIPVLSELLLLAVMITLAQVVFLTDKWILNMSMMIRNVLLFISVLIVMAIMIVVFKWFPVDDMTAWLGFIISYVISLIISEFVTKLREKAENSKMQEALDKYNRRK